MAVEDLKKAVNSIINERLNSPVIGAFILSWMVLNWKVIVFLIFETQKKFEGDKIEYIQDHYLTDPWTYLWWPITFAILYPIISLITYSFTELINLAKNEVNFFIQKKRSIDAEQKIDLLKTISELKVNYKNLLDEKDDEIEVLSNTLTKQQQDFTNMSEAINEEKEEIEKTNDDQKNRIIDLEKENQNLKNDLQLTTDGDSDIKKEIKELRETEIKLRDKIEELENEQNTQRKKDKEFDYLEKHVDVLVSEPEALKFLVNLGKVNKNKYVSYVFPSHKIESFFEEIGLHENSPLDRSKIRLTNDGRKLYELLKSKNLENQPKNN